MTWLLELFLAVSPQPANPAAAVTQFWAGYADRLSHQDVDGLANFFAPDARLMVPGIDDVVGRLAIHGLLKTTLAQRTRPIETRLMPREVAAYDGVIYDQGDYIETMAPIGDPRRAIDTYGRYFAVWSEQPDGSWKIARLMLAPKKQPAAR